MVIQKVVRPGGLIIDLFKAFVYIESSQNFFFLSENTFFSSHARNVFCVKPSNINSMINPSGCDTVYPFHGSKHFLKLFTASALYDNKIISEKLVMNLL